MCRPHSTSPIHDRSEGGQGPMYSLAFQKMVDHLSHTNPPSSPISLPSSPNPFRNLVNNICKVPLSSSPLSAFSLESSEETSLHGIIEQLCKDLASPPNLTPQARETSPISDILDTSHDNTVDKPNDVDFLPASPSNIAVNYMESNPGNPPSTSSFDELVRRCSKWYEATHGESDGNSSPGHSHDSDFEPEVVQHSRMQTRSPMDSEVQGQTSISREHIAS